MLGCVMFVVSGVKLWCFVDCVIAVAAATTSGQPHRVRVCGGGNGGSSSKPQPRAGSHRPTHLAGVVSSKVRLSSLLFSLSLYVQPVWNIPLILPDTFHDAV